MNLIIIIILSLFISFIWLYYLKLIDVFENEKTKFILITFILGSIIPNIIYPIHTYIYEPLGIEKGSDPVSVFLYYTLGVGLLEEAIKILPVILILRFAKKEVNEPLDYVIYATVSALGFAFGENVEYAQAYGHEVLLMRSILSVPGHMFFSAMFIYGYVLYKHHQQPSKSIFLFATFGFVSHGIYDFLLSIESPLIGSLLNMIFFFLLVQIFITILNNSLNNSPFYKPNKTINQEKIRSQIAQLYVVVIFLIFAYYFYLNGATKGMRAFVWFLLFESFILGIIVVRLSRFSIIPGTWVPVKPEFPFTVITQNSQDNDFHIFFGILKIKGESYNDSAISQLYGEAIHIVPLSANRSALKKTHKGIIEKKLFLQAKAVFLVKVYFNDSVEQHKHFVLLAKTSGTTHAADNSPIASLNSLTSGDVGSLVFHEWVVLKKIK
ncbi:MAG: PrsW family intramembrane metalloprotease [Bacteroidia bacterium]|nr:PrsW family intramembrane metalloprotease [Bacteroidia bacterium]